jgi:hypothetical protein
MLRASALEIFLIARPDPGGNVGRAWQRPTPARVVAQGQRNIAADKVGHQPIEAGVELRPGVADDDLAGGDVLINAGAETGNCIGAGVASIVVC